MKMSPFQLVIIGFFVFAALAAVGVLSGIITLPQSADQKISGKVVAWGTIDPSAFGFTSNILQVNNKNISFSYVQKPLITFESGLNEAIASGRGPDLIIISQEQILRNQSKIALQSIDAETALAYKNTYINGADLFIVDEKVIGLPIAVNPLVMYYNDRLLTSAGFSKPPQYWDEMGSYVNALTVKNDDKDIRSSAIALGTFENINYPLDILSALLLQTDTPIVDTEENFDTNSNRSYTIYKPSLNSQVAGQVLDFFNAFSNPQKGLYSWNISLPEDIDAFTSEFSAIWFGYPTDEVRIKAKNPNLNYKITSIPQVRSSKNRLTYGKIYGVSVLKSSSNPVAASVIQQQLTRGDALQATIENSGLQYPYRTTPASALKEERSALFARQAIQVVGYYTPSFDFTYALFKNVLDQIASGALNTEKAVQRIESELNNYIIKNQL